MSSCTAPTVTWMRWQCEDAVQAMPGLELNAFDMGPGHAHYKEPFCTGRVSAGAGVAHAAAHGVAYSIDQALAMAAGRSEAVARLLRRLDHIAATELSITGRVLGVAQAFAGQGRRSRRGGQSVAEPALVDS